MDTKIREFNMDSWSLDKNRVLFISGIPGSGKSTISKKVGDEKNAVVIHGDYFFTDNSTTNDDTRKAVESYQKKHGRDKIDFADIRFVKEFDNVLKFIIDDARHLFKDRLVIFESAFIANEKYINDLRGKPIIIVKTPVYKSAHRAIYRNTVDFTDLVKSLARDFVSTYLFTSHFNKGIKKFESAMEAYKMAKKSADLLYLEELFTSIKSNQGGNNDQELRNVASVLKRRYGFKNVSIEIIDTMGRPFFGMSIYPSEQVIDKIVYEITEGRSKRETIEEIWAKNNDWNIEIDSKLLYDPSINANPPEIVSVLLHEIGHTVTSNTIPARFHKVLSYTMLTAPIKVKKIFTWSKARYILGVPLVHACGVSNFHSGVHEEVEADKFAVKEGYGEHLGSFMHKLIRANGNTNMDLTEHEQEKEIEIMTQWAMVNITELQYRKTKLRTSLNDEIQYNKSQYSRNYLIRIRQMFFSEDSRTKYEELVKENMLDKQISIMENVLEGFRDWISKDGQVKTIKQSEIDIITIEVNRIENEDDRLYVLDLIYDKLDVVNLSLDLLKDSKQAKRVRMSKSALESQRDQLNRLRADVMKLELTPFNYGITIRYPVGYEG